MPHRLVQSEPELDRQPLRFLLAEEEFFAEDLVPPDSSSSWSLAELRTFFDSGGMVTPV